jgi:cell division protein FtsW
MSGLSLPLNAAHAAPPVAAQFAPALDGWLLTASLGLLGLGLVMVTSSSLAIAHSQGLSPFYYAIRHVVAIAIGMGLGTWLYMTPLARIEHVSIWLIWGALALLLLPWVPGLGVRINGALRWIHLGVTNFQVVEATKLLMIMYMAGYCVRQRNQLPLQWRGILKPLGMTSIGVLLLLAQPDFGSAALILCISLGLLWLAGARASYFSVIAIIGITAMAGIAVLEPYRLQRFVGFLDPWADPYKSGFQLTQALIAVGRGEWFGVGLGDSVQKLFYLPEAHSDFIVAVIAEELGLAGVLLVIALFATLAGRSFVLGARALTLGNYYASYLAQGIALWFSLQALVSIGVNLGVLPTKGLTLPLISAGGSSVMMSVAVLGLLFNISYVVRSTPPPPNPALGSAGIGYSA